MRSEIYVGRQFGSLNYAYIGRAKWDEMRAETMRLCEEDHTEEQIAAALADPEGRIDTCEGGSWDENCEFALDQIIAIEVVDGVLEITQSVNA